MAASVQSSSKSLALFSTTTIRGFTGPAPADALVAAADDMDVAETLAVDEFAEVDVPGGRM